MSCCPHKQAVAAYEAELRRQTRTTRLLIVLYTVASAKLSLLFFDWLTR